MPEARLAKARATLPQGYQFGDAAPRMTKSFGTFKKGDVVDLGNATQWSPWVRAPHQPCWRIPAENAAEQLERRARLRRRSS